MYRSSLSAALIAGISSPLWADVPAVATDIAPVHALVSQVMEGVGTPDLIVPPRSSPHGYAMRPSEARALSGADLVVWVGPLLTPWLADPLDSLAGSASHIALMEQPGTHVLPFREGAMFEAHDHRDEGQETHGDHDHAEQHEDYDVQKHDDSDAHESKVHDDHGHDDEVLSDKADDDGGHGHVDSSKDPHVWLDPRNGQLWLGQIAEALIKLDPENAAQYRENAEAAQAAISSPLLEASIEGAQGVLLNVSGPSDIGLYEVNEAAEIIANAAHPDANIIFGAVIDDALGDEVRVTVIATGFDHAKRQETLELGTPTRKEEPQPQIFESEEF
ncbi:hypothetical protein LCGC14_2563210, partial [marine sediment metagenome]